MLLFYIFTYFESCNNKPKVQPKATSMSNDKLLWFCEMMITDKKLLRSLLSLYPEIVDGKVPFIIQSINCFETLHRAITMFMN